MNKIIPAFIIIGITLLGLYFIPYSTLDIENLKKSYHVGEPITFTGKQTGCNPSCDYHEIHIFDENKTTTVWSSAIISDGQPPWIIPKIFWNSENVIVGDVQDGPIVDMPGEYTVKYETKTLSVEKKFTVIPSYPPDSENSVTSEVFVLLTLYVSNQSFIHDPIDITVILDDTTIISDFFEVEGQHSFHPFYFELDKGRHTIHIESDNGVSTTEEFEINKEMWAVVTYWYYEDDDNDGPFFNFDIYDTPVGFL